MTNPVIWLGLSILLLAVGLAALVCVSLPALIGLARAARSAEKLFDTLDRELPRTLEAMRHTGADLSELADDMTDSVHSARNIAKQVDHSLSAVRQQGYQARRTTRSVAVGFRAAWRVLTKPNRAKPNRAKPNRAKPNRAKPNKSRSKRHPPIKPPTAQSTPAPPGATQGISSPPASPDTPHQTSPSNS